MDALNLPKQAIKQQTLEFGKALVELSNALNRIRSIEHDMDARYVAKKMLKDWMRMLSRIMMELKMALGDEAYRQIMESQLLNDEDIGQIDVLVDCMLVLPKAMRNQVEQYVEQLCRVYGKKKL